MKIEDTDLARFAALSDGIFAVVITVMVLELRPPEGYDFGALLGIWPNAVSYALSYLFIAVIWLNHHHVFRFGRKLTAVLAWSNFSPTCSRSRSSRSRLLGWRRAGSPVPRSPSTLSTSCWSS